MSWLHVCLLIDGKIDRSTWCLQALADSTKMAA